MTLAIEVRGPRGLLQAPCLCRSVDCTGTLAAFLQRRRPETARMTRAVETSESSRLRRDPKAVAKVIGDLAARFGMRAVQRALDPHDIISPGKIVMMERVD